MNSDDPLISMTFRDRRLLPSTLHTTIVAKLPCLQSTDPRGQKIHDCTHTHEQKDKYQKKNDVNTPAQYEDLRTSDVALNFLAVDLYNFIVHIDLRSNRKMSMASSLLYASRLYHTHGSAAVSRNLNYCTYDTPFTDSCMVISSS